LKANQIDVVIGYLVLILVVLILVMVATSCVTEPPRQYNLDDKQRNSCYAVYGGRYGYCDKRAEEL
jgi:hypothetical protein